MTVDRIAAGAFGTMAEDYQRGRPGWPTDAVAALVEATIGFKALITSAERLDG